MTAATEQQIHQLETQRFAAMAAGDVDTLASLCHNDLVYTHSTGTTDGKADLLDRLRNGSLRYTRLDLTVRLVTVVGSTAVVLEEMDASVLADGAAREIHSLGLAVWTWDANQWRFLAFHPLPQPREHPINLAPLNHDQIDLQNCLEQSN